MLIELTKLIRQDVSVWHKVKMLFPKSLLHSDSIEAKPIFPGDLVALWEMVDLLVLVEAFVEIALAA